MCGCLGLTIGYDKGFTWQATWEKANYTCTHQIWCTASTQGLKQSCIPGLGAFCAFVHTLIPYPRPFQPVRVPPADHTSICITRPATLILRSLSWHLTGISVGGAGYCRHLSTPGPHCLPSPPQGPERKECGVLWGALDREMIMHPPSFGALPLLLAGGNEQRRVGTISISSVSISLTLSSKLLKVL